MGGTAACRYMSSASNAAIADDYDVRQHFRSAALLEQQNPPPIFDAYPWLQNVVREPARPSARNEAGFSFDAAMGRFLRGDLLPL